MIVYSTISGTDLAFWAMPVGDGERLDAKARAGHHALEIGLIKPEAGPEAKETR